MTEPRRLVLLVAVGLIFAGMVGSVTHHQAVVVPTGIAAFIGTGTFGRDPRRTDAPDPLKEAALRYVPAFKGARA